MATALEEGATRAIAEARRRIAAESRSQKLEEAAETLVRLRRYPESAELLREAARGSSKAADLGARADYVARLRATPPKRESADPVEFMRAFLYEALAPNSSPDTLAPLAAEALKPTLADTRTALRSLLLSPSQTPASERDFGTYSLKWVASDAGDGIRVRAPVGGDVPDLTAWILEEAGRLRLLTIASTDPPARLAGRLLRDGDREGARRWLERAREMEPRSEETDVPLDRPVTTWFDIAKGDGDDLFLAALAFRQMDSVSEEDLGRLESLVAAKPDDLRRGALLALTLSSLGRREKSLPLLRQLCEREPRSESLAVARLAALDGLGRDDEAIELAAADLGKDPARSKVRRVLAGLFADKADFARAVKETAAIVEGPDATPTDTKNLAWYRMVSGTVDEKTVALAQQAATAMGHRSAPTLNALAAVYAEAGRPAEARAILLEALGLTGAEEPSAEDWYVVGRLLERFDLREDAAEAYRKATAPPKTTRPGESRAWDRAGGTVWLAKKRLAGMEKTKKG